MQQNSCRYTAHAMHDQFRDILLNDLASVCFLKYLMM